MKKTLTARILTLSIALLLASFFRPMRVEAALGHSYLTMRPGEQRTFTHLMHSGGDDDNHYKWTITSGSGCIRILNLGNQPTCSVEALEEGEAVLLGVATYPDGRTNRYVSNQYMHITVSNSAEASQDYAGQTGAKSSSGSRHFWGSFFSDDEPRAAVEEISHKCTWCGGSGTCKECGGEGRLYLTKHSIRLDGYGGGSYEVPHVCELCGGNGECCKCHGDGVVTY